MGGGAPLPRRLVGLLIVVGVATHEVLPWPVPRRVLRRGARPGRCTSSASPRSSSCRPPAQRHAAPQPAGARPADRAGARRRRPLVLPRASATAAPTCTTASLRAPSSSTARATPAGRCCASCGPTAPCACAPSASSTTTPASATCASRGSRCWGRGEHAGRGRRRPGAATVVLAVPGASGELVDRVQRDAARRPASRSSSCPRLERPHRRPGRSRRTSAPSTIGDVLGRHQVDTDLGARSPATSPASGCSSPAPAARSAPSCAARSTASGPSTLIMLDRDESALHAVQLSDLRPRPARLARRRCSPTSATSDGAEPRLRRAPARDRLPRRRAQAPADARAVPGRGLEDQRPRHPQRPASSAPSSGSSASSTSPPTRRPTPTQRARLDQAARRAAHRVAGAGRPGCPTSPCGSATCWARRGSMLHTFNTQIAAGGPITVTHPDVTRYFMTIPEACELVVQAGAIGRRGRGDGARDGRAGPDPRRGASG